MYLYYAIFSPDNGKYAVEFPDLEGAYTFGDSMSEALYMAKDLLEGWLIVAEDEGDKIPAPSYPQDIKSEKDDLIIPIEVNLNAARLKHSSKLIKKTLSIPEYINELAKENNINFSQTLTEALKEKLDV